MRDRYVWLPAPDYPREAGCYRDGLLIGSVSDVDHPVIYEEPSDLGVPPDDLTRDRVWGWWVGGQERAIVARGVARDGESARAAVEAVADALGWLGCGHDAVGVWEVPRG